MPYAINILNYSTKIEGEYKESFPFYIILSIYSNYKNIALKIDSEIILYEYRTIDSPKFTYYGKITEDLTETTDEAKSIQGAEKLFQYTVRIVGLLKEDNRLYDLAYSLIKVTKFLEPEKHFVRAYSYLSDPDYKTILEGNIFISRTAFGKFVNALHRDHRINFAQYFVDNEPETFFDTKDYVKAITILREYIEYHILKPINYLKESYEILREISGGDFDRIGFSDDEGKVYLIKKQLDFVALERNDIILDRPELQNLDTIEQERILLREIERGVQEFRESEIELSKNFKKTNWPIQL